MKCEELSTTVIDELNEELSEHHATELHRHLMSCAACRDELEGLRQVWTDLGELADEEPTAALSGRFYSMLDAYEHGLQARRPSVWSTVYEGLSSAVEAIWPKRPMVQFAMTAAMTAAALVVGLGVGQRLGPASPSVEMADLEMTTLRGEVDSLNRMVSLSLLEQDSASARLQGVSYGVRSGDEEVLAALTLILVEDENTNVRLAAIDALARFADREPVAEGLRTALFDQRSPLVQVALLDALLQVNGPRSEAAIRELYASDDVDDRVRRHIDRRLGQTIPDTTDTGL